MHDITYGISTVAKIYMLERKLYVRLHNKWYNCKATMIDQCESKLSDKVMPLEQQGWVVDSSTWLILLAP